MNTLEKKGMREMDENVKSENEVILFKLQKNARLASYWSQNEGCVIYSRT